MSQATPLSLAAYFVPPVDNVGIFSMLTGFSADDHFLNDALEKFTLNIKSQRAYEGVASIALMLDEKHPQISSIDCPGLAHLASKHTVNNKFKLLHAKVGLLLFKNKKTAQQIIRLVVSTGNWTCQTLEDSLDLVWSIDYKVGKNQDEQAQTDIAKAYEFVEYTLRFFDDSLLSSRRSNDELTPTGLRYQQFKVALKAVTLVEGVEPRFFDNRSMSLLDQLPTLISFHASGSKRNYLSIGSGFYEGGNLVGQMPKAIYAIEQKLRESELLTQKPEKDIFVNPLNCQAIATSTEVLNKNQWNIRPAFDAFYEGKNNTRTLHAKFIFSASDRAGKCQIPWVYIGSGNITAQVFIHKASLHRGNLEAGIVFSPIGLNWYNENNPDLCVSSKLPINWDNEKIITDANAVNAGAEMSEHDGQYLAAPISYFTLSKTNEGECILLPSEITEQNYQVLTSQNEVCQTQDGKILWPILEPRQVNVQWQYKDDSFHAYIPVFDEFGRLAATALPELEIDDVWMQLGAFPTLPNENDNDGESAGSSKGESSSNSNYHINKMMTLIEYIAQKQSTTNEFDWPQWCHRLEQTFCQMEKSSVIQYFQSIGINPLSPLWARPFRPTFAEDNKSYAGRLYEQALSNVETALKLTNLLQLGGKYE